MNLITLTVMAALSCVHATNVVDEGGAGFIVCEGVSPVQFRWFTQTSSVSKYRPCSDPLTLTGPAEGLALSCTEGSEAIGPTDPTLWSLGRCDVGGVSNPIAGVIVNLYRYVSATEGTLSVEWDSLTEEVVLTVTGGGEPLFVYRGADPDLVAGLAESYFLGSTEGCSFVDVDSPGGVVFYKVG